MVELRTDASPPYAPPPEATGQAPDRLVSGAADVAIVATDRAGRITAWDAGAERMLGWTSREMLGATLDRTLAPEDREQDRIGAAMRDALATGRATGEQWHRGRDGARIWIGTEITPLRAADGAPLGFLAMLRDRTRQLLAAGTPDADIDFLHAVLASSGDCIKILDLDGRLLFMTERGQQLMAVGDFDAIRGCPWADLWQGPYRNEARAAIQVARHGGVGHFQGVADTLAGIRKFWDVRVTPILGNDGRPQKLLSVSRDLTEAQDSRERIELALDAGAVVATWVWDVQRDRMIGDRRFARAFSLDPEQLSDGLTLAGSLGSIHPDDRARVRAQIDAATARGGPYSAEYRIPGPDGAWSWVEASGHCDLDADGRPLRFPGILLDIDRRKRHELRQEALLGLGETLRGLSETLRALGDAADPSEMDHAAAAMIGPLLDADRAGYGTVDAVRASIHVDRDWLSGSTSGSLVGLHRFADYGSYIDDLLRGETVAVADVEHDPLTRQGVERLRAIGVRALLNVPLMQNGRLVALLFVNSATRRVWTDDEIAFVRAVADRTWAARQQAQAEAELRRLNETLETRIQERTRERDQAWRLSQDLLVVSRTDGTIIAINAAWTTLLGWTGHELVGSTFVGLVHPDELEATVAAFCGIASAPMTHPYEHRLRHRDGSYRWFAWTGAFEDGQVYASGRDTTAQHEQAGILRATEAQLRQAQKMEAVGQLTGGLAHDFNNLLTGITGSLELLQTRIAQGRIDAVDRYVDAAQGAARRAAALTHRLLAFSRRQTLDPRATDVNRLVAGMEELIRRTVGPEIMVEPHAGADTWSILVDPSQLENALLNLCINARDAMPGGGRITIETRNLRLDRHAAAERDLPPGPYVSLCVSDTGTGMAPDVIAQAFDPFFTTKAIGMGTGLGLSMIYGFARQSGGQVRIHSEVGRGTSVCIHLPRHLGEAEAEAEPQARGDLPRARHGQTVLLVDDEPTVRMLVTEVLQDLGYTAIEATDGAAGLAILNSDAHIDLLVTDVGLPGGINGRQMADAARVARPALKVLFITGYAANAVLSHGHLDPGMHVLTKPFTMEALASRIRELISTPPAVG